MSFQVINNRQAFFESRDRWNQVSGNLPFQSWEWCFHWYDNVESASRPAIVVDRIDDGEWAGIAPMVQCQTRLGASKVYVMGSGPTCTDYANLISSTAPAQPFSKKYANWLGSQRKTGDFEVVEFEGMELDSPETAKLAAAMAKAGYRVNALPMESCWKVPLEDNWDSLNRGFSKKHRRKTKKAVSRLSDPTVEVKFATEGNFEQIWSAFVELHQKRRKMTQQAGCFADPKFESFLRQASRGLLDRDLCEIIQISIDNKPIAATLLFHDQENAFMYQTGFDPEFQSWEPGYMLIVSAMKWAISRTFQTFDFLRGNEPYKARWNTTEIPLVKLRFVANTSMIARIRDYAWREYLQLRRRAKWLRSGTDDPTLHVAMFDDKQ